MDKRKISFENNEMRKSNQDIITLPTPTKENNLVKPDFSRIFICSFETIHELLYSIFPVFPICFQFSGAFQSVSHSY